ncbi:hypothetical protein EDD75_0353 [Thermodesulfitimonas autotrophica]|uniref:Lipoprotein n=1 Tax=Thermodesulfitimonas autotrophica TaxID=1894989 RepID=A0A3N5AX81_9THEO|nr:hypothetical protein [Thermodesulfitimonas autotrophica]RPF49537.1 hypothetical protein EDD75_0353 [Thermodesulfitimonas autotrophica]
MRKKVVAVLVTGCLLAAGCGAKKDIRPIRSSGAPKPAVCAEQKDTVTGVVRKDGSWYLLSAGGRNYVLVPGNCDSESARKAIESHVGKPLTVRGEADGSKLRVDEVKS